MAPANTGDGPRDVRDGASRSARLLRAAPAVLAVVALTLWLALVGLRIAHPYELEWMEGGMLDHVARVRAGEPLYTAPSLTFGSYPYTPLYPWAAAASSWVVGEGFLGARLVSVLATLGTLWLLARTARVSLGEEPASAAGLLSAGLFAAGYGFTGAWYDLARVDALATLLGLAAFHVARVGGSNRAAVRAGLLAVLACLCKQSLLALAVAIVVVFLRRSWRAAAVYGVTFVAALTCAVVVMQHTSEGWFRFWTFDVLRDAPREQTLVLGYWIECGRRLGVASAVVAVAFALGLFRRIDLGLLAVIGAGLASGWIGRSHQGGFENNLILPLLAVALVFGPAGARLVEARGPWASALVSLALLALAYDPRGLVPTRSDRDAGDRFVEQLAELTPPVLLPDRGYLLRRAFGPGTRQGIHGIVVNDLLKSGHDDLAQDFVQELERALAQQKFGAVILDERWDDDLGALRAHYQAPVPVPWPDEHTFMPASGAPKRPSWLYLPR